MEPTVYERLGQIADVLHFFKLNGLSALLTRVIILLRLLGLEHEGDLNAFITARDGEHTGSVKERERWAACEYQTEIRECGHPDLGPGNPGTFCCHQQNCPWLDRQMNDDWWVGHPGRMKGCDEG